MFLTDTKKIILVVVKLVDVIAKSIYRKRTNVFGYRSRSQRTDATSERVPRLKERHRLFNFQGHFHRAVLVPCAQ